MAEQRPFDDDASLRAERALDDELARLGAATRDLAPTQGLVDEVTRAVARAAEPVEQAQAPERGARPEPVEAALARLGAATRDLAPDPGLDVALDHHLARARRGLAAKRPDAARQASPERPRTLTEGVTRVGPAAVVVAALAAAASALVWLETEKSVSAELLTTSSVMEASE